MNPVKPPLEARWLGVVDYDFALELQRDLVIQRRTGLVADQMLLVEHPHVITLGTAANPENILVGADERRLLGIDVFSAGRGGDVTYHGPGQLVGYPIIDLKPDRCDLHRYVRDMETAIIRTLDDYGIEAGRVDGLTGVWVENQKIAAIGVRVSSGWITSHGFALNVDTDLRFFDSIVPCGIRDRGVTSMTALLDRPVDVEEVGWCSARHVAEIYGRTLGAGAKVSAGSGGADS